MANEKTPVVWDDTTKKHRPLGTGEKMGGLDASSIISSDSGNLIQTGSDGLALVTGTSLADPRADNLLETSSNGKLQVTVDRIAEWLDGHPQDAALIADAINVVSGDSGNVIVEGTDKGAFLSKGAIAAAVAGMTDAQKAQLANAIAARIASDIADGKTIVASNGKLTSDPTNATAAQKKAINQALADQDSGLVVNPSTGKLQVDFSDMPTDKFEKLLKGLKMTVPLAANKTLYVSINNANAVVPTTVGGEVVYPDGCGTSAKPFKYIHDCVNYATSTYSVGNFHITIRVVAGTYPENVALPAFSHGTGYIEIVPDSGARDVIVQAQTNSYGSRGWCFSCTGGRWRLYYMDARRTENPTTQKAQALGCYGVSGDGMLYLYGCAATQTLPSSPSPLGGEDYTVRIFSADGGGTMYLQHGTLAGSISAHKPASGTPTVHVFNVSRGGTLWLTSSYDEDNNPVTTQHVACSGSCDVFLRMFQVGAINTLGAGNRIDFTGSMTGTRYVIDGGSHVSGAGGDASYFPGTSGTGTVEASTYCWGLPDNS